MLLFYKYNFANKIYIEKFQQFNKLFLFGKMPTRPENLERSWQHWSDAHWSIHAHCCTYTLLIRASCIVHRALESLSL
jgi:hypothetical protein